MSLLGREKLPLPQVLFKAIYATATGGILFFSGPEKAVKPESSGFLDYAGRLWSMGLLLPWLVPCRSVALRLPDSLSFHLFLGPTTKVLKFA
jgi:hypothetical protein